MQVSFSVQAVPSLQAAVLFVWTQPRAGLQPSSVHTFASSQLKNVATPAWIDTLSNWTRSPPEQLTLSNVNDVVPVGTAMGGAATNPAGIATLLSAMTVFDGPNVTV